MTRSRGTGRSNSSTTSSEHGNRVGLGHHNDIKINP